MKGRFYYFEWNALLMWKWCVSFFHVSSIQFRFIVWNSVNFVYSILCEYLFIIHCLQAILCFSIKTIATNLMFFFVVCGGSCCVYHFFVSVSIFLVAFTLFLLCCNIICIELSWNRKNMDIIPIIHNFWIINDNECPVEWTK